MLVSLITMAVILSVIIVPGLLLQAMDEKAESQKG